MWKVSKEEKEGCRVLEEGEEEEEEGVGAGGTLRDDGLLFSISSEGRRESTRFRKEVEGIGGREEDATSSTKPATDILVWLVILME